MRVVRLQAENLKRLRAVDISPEDDVVVVSGRNGQGKTSVLDAIWFALGGAAAQRDTDVPIRQGNREAEVTLDLGELTVTRRWRLSADGGNTTNLTVVAANGAKYSSPQKVLDELVGKLAFDPLEFSRLDAREQRLYLLRMVDLPFDVEDLDRQRAAIFDERTEVGRERKRVSGAIKSLPDYDRGAPDAEVSVSALSMQIEEAIAARAFIDDRNARMDYARRRLEAAQVELREAEAMFSEFSAVDVDVERSHLPSVAELRKQIETVEQTNASVRVKQQAHKLEVELDYHQGEWERHSGRLERLDKYRDDGLRQATMPIAGLTVSEDAVTYNGVPLAQCSSAEQLRVSVAIAMAMNPRLRVIRVTDGSLLDSDNLRVIEDMARDNDFQVWVERVDESGSVGVVIEDGSVVL